MYGEDFIMIIIIITTYQTVIAAHREKNYSSHDNNGFWLQTV